MVRKVVIGAAVFPLAVSVLIFGPTNIASASGSFNLTLTQARNMTACLPRSTIDPNAARVCFSGRMWVNSLPSYAQSSNQRFDFCATALKITAAGDIVALPFLFDPLTTFAYVGAIERESVLLSACYG
jgi:hypothetical protein